MLTTSASELAKRIEEAMRAIIVGGEGTTFGLLVGLFARGHALIEGVPGTGKTLAVRALASLIRADYRRVQFTPDLLPADLIGTTVFNPQTAQFSLRPGPIVTNFLLADEVNRTPPKTQSALLEAMEEARVTIDGTPLALPQPFFVCATQNPIEYEGTYPLPEAQLDRFLVKIESTYPQRDQELELLARVAAGFDARAIEPATVNAVTETAEILQAQAEVRRVHVSAAVQRYVLDVIEATRAHRRLSLGASPRAGVSLLVAAQAAAAIDARDYATPDDVKSVAPLVLPHRLIVQPQAEIDGVRASSVVEEILHSVAVPRSSEWKGQSPETAS
jgi:MoxR-like ATPase